MVAAAALATAQGASGPHACVVGTGNGAEPAGHPARSSVGFRRCATLTRRRRRREARPRDPRPEKYTEGHGLPQAAGAGRPDAVVIATPDSHAMAVDTMRAGYTRVEVPGLTVDECWSLVNTSAETGVPA